MKKEIKKNEKGEAQEQIVEIIKFFGSLVISIGVSTVITNLITATTNVNKNKFIKMCMTVGTFFIASSIAAAASNKFEQDIDTVYKTVEEFNNKINGK